MRVNQFGEFGKDFHNLIGTFTTSSDNHNIRFRLLRDSMLKHCLTRTERARDKARSSLYNRIHRVDNTNSGFQQFKRTGLFFIISHCTLHRPSLNHIDCNILTFFIGEYGNGIFNLIIPFGSNRLHRAGSFQCKRRHNLQRLEIFVYLSQPCRGFHLVAYIYQRHEMPLFFFIQRICILSSLKENTIHLVEVVLQTVVVFR